jgi:uncharacterized protein YjbI with pentapeptide repeats
MPQWGIRGRPNRKQILRTVGISGIIIGIVVVALVLILGYRVEPFVSATGLGETIYTKETTQFGDEGSVVKTDRADDPRRAKTLWDWLQLLIVPAVLAAGGVWFNLRQDRRARRAEDLRAQDEALQAYLDQMSELLIDKKLHDETAPHSDKRVTARARTVTVLSQLNGDRPRRVLQFLYETRLISRGEILENRKIEPRVVGLSGADLTGAKLRYIKLKGTALDGANLENADLREAKLSGIDLGGAYLSGADLSDADLRGADLANASLQRDPDRDLEGANLSRADLRGATLSGADLSGANLSKAKLVSAFLQAIPDRELKEADLSGADLTGADLTNAKVTDKQLASCRSLEGANLPNRASPNNCDEQG